MKKLTIGRGIDCDVVINDESDHVSRHHADLFFSFWGKMKLVDKSANGTFVNSKQIPKDKLVDVKRTDKVSLADKWDLDWNTIKDPYSTIRPLSIIGGILALAALTFGIIWGIQQFNKPIEPAQEETVETTPTDTLPANTDTPADNATVAPSKGKTKSTKVTVPQKTKGKPTIIKEEKKDAEGTSDKKEPVKEDSKDKSKDTDPNSKAPFIL